MIYCIFGIIKIHSIIANIIRRLFYTLKCSGCGEKFQSYGNKKRKFSSHLCYMNYSFKRGKSLNDEGAI